MNLKPFNLEQALAGAPVVTREGHEVHDLVGQPSLRSKYRLCGVVSGERYSWTDSGECERGLTDELDLCMAPRKVTRWGFVADEDELASAIMWESKEAAEKAIESYANLRSCTLCRIEWEE